MTRDNLGRLLTAALCLVAIGWLVTSTEWVEVEVEQPARGAAARNPFYATQVLARKLGAKVSQRETLDALPAPDARMVLTSQLWDLFPERAQGLQAWVESGGQLVIPGWLIDHRALNDWIGVGWTDKAVDKTKGAARNKKVEACHELNEPEAVPASYPGKRSFTICANPSSDSYSPSLQETQKPLWALQGEHGLEVLRVAVGKGSVTVIGPWDLLQNRQLVRQDNALLIAAALQLRDGADILFVAENTRESLLPWLWQQAWPVLLLGLLALAVALWRAGLRFGPRFAPAGLVRRSMTEQVLGTAQFLHQQGRPALHQAQLRALDEVARTVLRNYNTLSNPARAERLAAVTGLAASELLHALRPWNKASAHDLSQQLELLETARRRLLEKRARTSVASISPTA